MFTIEKRDLRRLMRFYRRAPREMKRATAGVLNSVAFEDRKDSIAEVNRSMTVRDPRFIEGAIRFQRTRITEINRQEAISGSINRNRFTGWDEQQFGKPSRKGRVASVLARTGGSWQKKMTGTARLKSANDFTDSSSMPANSADGRVFALIAKIKRDKNRTPFIIREGRRWTHGLYKLKGRRIIRLQNFEETPRPRRNPWKTNATTRMKRRVNLRMIWAREINKVLARARR